MAVDDKGLNIVVITGPFSCIRIDFEGGKVAASAGILTLREIDELFYIPLQS